MIMRGEGRARRRVRKEGNDKKKSISTSGEKAAEGVEKKFRNINSGFVKSNVSLLFFLGTLLSGIGCS